MKYNVGDTVIVKWNGNWFTGQGVTWATGVIFDEVKSKDIKDLIYRISLGLHGGFIIRLSKDIILYNELTKELYL